jgi:hypothetical protein
VDTRNDRAVADLRSPTESCGTRASPPRAENGRARLRARGSGERLSLTSDLTQNEPVTEAEIALVLAVLGDTIASILNPDTLACPTSAPTSGA